MLALQGDPDLYANGNATGGTFPDNHHYDLTSNTVAGESLTVVPSADGTCTGCSYRISVYAYDANTEFLISATTRVGVRLLSDGVLVTGATGMGEVRYFRFFVRSAADVLLTLTPYSGNPSLLARFGCRPLYESALCNATGGGAGASSSTVWSSANDVGVEQILLPASDPAFCTPPCTLYVAVRGNTEHGVIATQAQEQQSLVTLVDGLPQSGSVGADEMTYYRIWARMDEGLTIALTSFLGSPIFYYNAADDGAGDGAAAPHVDTPYGRCLQPVPPPLPATAAAGRLVRRRGHRRRRRRRPSTFKSSPTPAVRWRDSSRADRCTPPCRPQRAPAPSTASMCRGMPPRRLSM